MMYLDSWVWISFFSDEMTSKRVEKILERLEAGERAVFSVIGLTELLYVMRRRAGRDIAARIHQAVLSFRGLVLLPVTEDVAVLATGLRDKYYDKKKRAFSYADAVHLATACLAGCARFYTGDPDFSGISEMECEILA